MARFASPALPRCLVREGQFIGVRGAITTQNRWIWSRVLRGGSIPAVKDPSAVVVDALDRNGAIVVPRNAVIRLPYLIVPNHDGWRGREVMRDAKYCILDGYNKT
jgi:hypothetical protein